MPNNKWLNAKQVSIVLGETYVKGALLMVSLTSVNTDCSSSKWLQKKSAPSSKSAFDCILCTDQKSLQKISIKVWLTLFKHGNNLYEHWK